MLGFDALETGFAFLPTMIVMGALSVRYSEPLVMRFGARAVLIPGLVLIAASLAYFTLAGVDGNYWVDVLPVMILLGAGGGLAFPALMTLSMSSATLEDAGLASGLINTSGQVGAAVGLALLATLSASRAETLAGDGTPSLGDLVSGYHLAFWVAAGLIGLGIVLAVAGLAAAPKRDLEIPADLVSSEAS